MAKSKPYNGHPSYNAWNVALWIGNDEGLYNMARGYVRQYRHRGGVRAAAQAFVEAMTELGQPRTDDDVRWTVTNVARAMRGM